MATTTDSMLRILNSCVQIDTMAAGLYGLMASATVDAHLAELFTAMEKDERQHLAWWLDLSERWSASQLAAPFLDPDDTARQLAAVVEEIQTSVPADLSGLTERDMLLVATKVEYFALEPSISELIGLVGGEVDGQEQYDEHLERLMVAIEEYGYVDDALSAFLVRVLRRAWHNSSTLASVALKDGLSGLYNRRALTTLLEQTLATAVRYSEPLSVLMIDIDDFKSVNDGFGHAVGDKALVAVADVLRESTRSADMVARFGGDEFVIVAPKTGRAGAELLAERIEAAIGRTRIMPEGPSVSLSIGVAVLEASKDVGLVTADQILRTADTGLYRAKEQGKNRCSEPVVVHAA